ncbi:hypothetical protein CMEL01_11897 [Colletotrichum melonis]|uniref:Uncharacterized protein n=1 Tax=Colletotrichum melonis TaxID=1209925 RepID=A0AAI9UZH4_9PEZI|nr:hypothetical protein CMEL01_11897 [Colletotrichum melonis]
MLSRIQQDAEANTSTGPDPAERLRVSVRRQRQRETVTATASFPSNSSMPTTPAQQVSISAGRDTPRPWSCFLSFTASQKRTTRWFYQPGLVTQILGALMQALWGVISSACDRKHTRVPPQFAQQ